MRNGVYKAHCYVDSLAFSNLGPTKAFPIEIRSGWTIGGPLPSDAYLISSQKPSEDCIFEPEPVITQRKSLASSFELSPGDWALICGGNSIFGSIASSPTPILCKRATKPVFAGAGRMLVWAWVGA
jgi:hypothetical protein